jgi:hypothetical protein
MKSKRALLGLSIFVLGFSSPSFAVEVKNIFSLKNTIRNMIHCHVLQQKLKQSRLDLSEGKISRNSRSPEDVMDKDALAQENLDLLITYAQQEVHVEELHYSMKLAFYWDDEVMNIFHYNIKWTLHEAGYYQEMGDANSDSSDRSSEEPDLEDHSDPVTIAQSEYSEEAENALKKELLKNAVLEVLNEMKAGITEYYKKKEVLRAEGKLHRLKY